MKRIGNILKNRTTRTLALAATAVAGLIALPASASAGPRDWHRDDRSHEDRSHNDRSRTDVKIDINLGRPEYETRSERVWVEPVYQTVIERVWVAPVTRDDCVRVWVPAQYEIRDVVHGDRHHRWTTREHVLVAPAHYEDQHRAVVVCDGHYEDVQHQEMISPGHFEYRTERVRVAEVNPFINFFARFGR